MTCPDDILEAMRMVAVLLMTFAAAQATAQSTSDVAEILKRVSAVYDVERYEIKVEAIERRAPSVTSRLQFSFSRPNRYRMQGHMPGMGSSQGWGY